MVWKPSTPWTANSTSPQADQNHKNGDRSSGGSGNPAYAPFPVEITQPQAGLATTSRYYKQYTGIPYNVKAYVRGGDFSALQYSLTAAPSGMTINSTTGEINWPNPVEAGSPHAITLEVTDGLTTDTVSWTLTVDTANTIFVDSVNGNASNDGSIGSPLSDITDWYGSTKGNSTYSGYQVYYRAGTYNVDCIPKNEPTGGVTLSGNKPLVHLAYPGETATLDCSLGHWFMDSATDDVYFDGFTVTDVGQYVTPSGGEGVWFSRLYGNRHIYRRNTFANAFPSLGLNNQAFIMSPSGPSNYWGISENSFDWSNVATVGYAMAVFYDTEYSVVESNYVVGADVIGIGYKTDNGTQTVRGNWIEGTGALIDSIGFGSDVGTGNAEISWNYARGGQIRINYGAVGADLPFYFIRNTSNDRFNIREWDTESDADLTYVNNVVVGSSLYENELTVDTGKIVDTDNLINSSSTNFLDETTGLLIDGFESQNDTRGHNGLAGLK